MNEKQEIALALAKEIVNTTGKTSSKKNILYGINRLAVKLDAYSPELEKMWVKLSDKHITELTDLLPYGAFTSSEGENND